MHSYSSSVHSAAPAALRRAPPRPAAPRRAPLRPAAPFATPRRAPPRPATRRASRGPVREQEQPSPSWAVARPRTGPRPASESGAGGDATAANGLGPNAAGTSEGELQTLPGPPLRPAVPRLAAPVRRHPAILRRTLPCSVLPRRAPHPAPPCHVLSHPAC